MFYAGKISVNLLVQKLPVECWWNWPRMQLKPIFARKNWDCLWRQWLSKKTHSSPTHMLLSGGGESVTITYLCSRRRNAGIDTKSSLAWWETNNQSMIKFRIIQNLIKLRLMANKLRTNRKPWVRILLILSNYQRKDFSKGKSRLVLNCNNGEPTLLVHCLF